MSLLGIEGRLNLRRWKRSSALALVGVALLLLTGLGIGVADQRAYELQSLRQAQVQAKILASSVSAALSFQDMNAAREYVAALGANPEIEVAGVYDDHGALVAGYGRQGMEPPSRAYPRAWTREGDRLTVTAPVMEGGAGLGMVLLRTVLDPPERRLTRYGGVALMLGMALLVVAVLGAAQATANRAHRALKARAAELDHANRELRIQISEREKAEEALRQAQRLEALGRLTGGVAHDFNNILMVASSGLDLLERAADPARRETIRAAVRQAVERGASLTRQLLTFARRSALKPEAVELGSQMRGMRILLQGSLREDVQLVLDLPPELWPVEVDPGQLELAVLNLVVNARDAMGGGGRIRIVGENLPDFDSGGLKGDFVRLSVEDTGPGFSAEQLPHVFEPFFTTKEVGRGAGLGLSQVYGFARGSGGEARIDSRPGEGARVSLYLPRSKSEPVAATAASVVEPRPEGSGRRVLLVEDDPGVAAMVGDMLRDLGFRVVHAPAAGAALETLSTDPDIDAVFSDMVMPGGMDGMELAREIERRWPGVPVLLTTGFSPAAAAAEREGRKLLPKPYSMDSLARALAACAASGR